MLWFSSWTLSLRGLLAKTSLPFCWVWLTNYVYLLSREVVGIGAMHGYLTLWGYFVTSILTQSSPLIDSKF
ncbi:hypothetical protein F5Y12DRAFT_759550 [Xylaria sp. FL1777]|nr:hypothetical protein F5Y12DRAFT_759550 [Xylaria sp. FL1777]